MSQDAGAPQSNRSSGPAYVYGPMVYQFPPPDREGGETEKPKPKSNQSNQGTNFLVLLLIVVLVVGGVILYLKENGIDIRQLSFRRSMWKEQTFNPANEDQWQAPVITQARVATDGLYLREGPGIEYVATYLLPENWDVSLVGDYQTDNDGEVWARILVETDEGLQEGWVNRRFLE
ncbi:MAG: hypothetical protein ACREA2_15125 [Blastocatellia bacterium]